MAKRTTVQALASQAGLDLDQTLVALWEAQIDDVDSPDDLVPNALIRQAEDAVGIVRAKQQMRIDYWLERTGHSRAEFVEILDELGVVVRPNMRRLPKGGLKRVRARFVSAPVSLTKPHDVMVLEPLDWEVESVGSVREMNFLTERDLRDIHRALTEDFKRTDDPIYPPGVSMKIFSDRAPADLRPHLETRLNILRSRWREPLCCTPSFKTIVSTMGTSALVW